MSIYLGSEMGALIKEFASTSGAKSAVATVKRDNEAVSVAESSAQANVPSESLIDGYLFSKKFYALQNKMRDQQRQNYKKYKIRKDKVLNMGQSLDFMPKELGR